MVDGYRGGLFGVEGAEATALLLQLGVEPVDLGGEFVADARQLVELDQQLRLVLHLALDEDLAEFAVALLDVGQLAAQPLVVVVFEP